MSWLAINMAPAAYIRIIQRKVTDIRAVILELVPHFPSLLPTKTSAAVRLSPTQTKFVGPSKRNFTMADTNNSKHGGRDKYNKLSISH